MTTVDKGIPPVSLLGLRHSPKRLFTSANKARIGGLFGAAYITVPWWQSLMVLGYITKAAGREGKGESFARVIPSQ